MASVALGAVGSAVAGPIGGFLGGQIGSIIDNKIFNHRSINKPSITDLIVEASTFGVPIPVPYGRCKIAGNLIQSSMLRAHKHTTGSGKSGKSGGKGGVASGSAGGTQYYTYDVTCAVAICRGPINNVYRIYADSKVIWDSNPVFVGGSGSVPQPWPLSLWTPFASGDGGTATLSSFGMPGTKNSNTQSLGGTVSIYFGTETQPVDSELAQQAAMIGAGNVAPAYRGIAYAVFHGLPLQSFGNRIPNFAFEVNGFNSTSGASTGLLPYGNYNSFGGTHAYFDQFTNKIYAEQVGMTVFNVSDGSTAEVIKSPLTGLGAGYTLQPANTTSGMTAPDGSTWWPAWTTGFQGSLINISPYTGIVGAFTVETGQSIFGAFGPALTYYCGATNILAVFSGGSGSSDYGLFLIDSTGIPTLHYQGSVGVSALEAAYSDVQNRLVIVGNTSGHAGAVVIDHVDSPVPTVSSVIDYSSVSTSGNPPGIMYDAVEDVWILVDNTDIWTLSDPTNLGSIIHHTTFTALTAGTAGAASSGGAPGADWFNQLPKGSFAVTTFSTYVYLVSSHDLTLVPGGVVSNPWNFGLTTVSNAFYIPGPVPCVALATGTLPGWVMVCPTQPCATPLAAVVKDICETCQIPAGMIDTSALTDCLLGYLVSQEASGRAAIEPLQEMYLFDLIETNHKLTARYRAGSVGSPAMTILANDLGARPVGSGGGGPGSSPAPKVIETRTQDVELPQAVALRYRTASGDLYVKDFSMAIASQYAKRSRASVHTITKLSISTAVVLADSTAAAIAGKVLAIRYNQRTKLLITLPIKYLALDPGDTVTLSWTDTEGNTASYFVYIHRIDAGADNTLRIEGVGVDPVSYNVANPAQSPVTILQQTPAVSQPTTLRLLELPPLQDIDDDVGMYWAATGVGSGTGWSASLYRSIDGGVSWLQIGGTTSPAALGVATTALAAPRSDRQTGLWDMDNTVTVSLLSGTLTSVQPNMLLAGANICAIGKEILGYLTATQNADKTWTLSGLLRGLQGTDIWDGSHAAGDKFTFLDKFGSVQDDNEGLGAVGPTWLYEGITTGSAIIGAPNQALALTGLRIMPEPVANAGAISDASNNITIGWVPRKRINYQWLDGATENVLDEPVEAYEVDVLSGSTVVRTITSWTTVDAANRSASYTAANQTTDGLTPGSSPITFTIYQISNRIGRGVPRHIGPATPSIGAVPVAPVPVIIWGSVNPIFDNTPLGTTVATFTVAMSDGSAFVGTVGFGAPNSDDGGRFIISGPGSGVGPYALVLNPSGPGLPASKSTENTTVTATQP